MIKRPRCQAESSPTDRRCCLCGADLLPQGPGLGPTAAALEKAGGDERVRLLEERARIAEGKLQTPPDSPAPGRAAPRTGLGPRAAERRRGLC